MVRSPPCASPVASTRAHLSSPSLFCRNWNRGASCWVLDRGVERSQRQKDGRDDADAGGRKLHESPAIIALVDSSTDSPSCWIDKRFSDARTLDFLVRSSKSPKSVSSPSTRSCYDL
ncbi:hypothetical protein LXL04_012528 [Taraxacum kok-saghyz]